jgi:hypothetical protein
VSLPGGRQKLAYPDSPRLLPLLEIFPGCVVAGEGVEAGPPHYRFPGVVAGPAGVPSVSRLLSNSSLFVQTEKYECKSVETFQCSRSGLTPRMSPPRTPWFQPMRQESDTGMGLPVPVILRATSKHFGSTGRRTGSSNHEILLAEKGVKPRALCP